MSGLPSRRLVAAADRPDRQRPPLAAGTTLAPGYEVVAHLRRGNDLDVYDVWSKERGCRCVAKTVRPGPRGRANAHRGLLREGRLLLRLTHPHIVRVYEVLTDPRPIVVLETLPGETLAHLLERRRRRLALIEIAHLGLHVASAIGYLHRRGYLHLDLKPSNVVATGGLARVLDLSLAQRPGRIPAGRGTAGYLSPEQAAGGVVGPAADVWGIGALLYEAATDLAPGERPFEGVEGVENEPTAPSTVSTPSAPSSSSQATSPWESETSGSTAPSPQEAPPAPIRRYRRLPPEFAELVDACLALDPSRRPALPRVEAVLATIVGGSNIGAETAGGEATAGFD